jgi:hypothetical protein
VEVRRLFVEGRDNLIVVDCQGEVREVNLLIRGAHNPFEAIEVFVRVSFEGFPAFGVSGRIGDYPNTKHIINTPSVEYKVLLEQWEESFAERVVNVDPGGSRRGTRTHRGTFELFPKSDAESEYITRHNYS